jgi:hypothetical protein
MESAALRVNDAILTGNVDVVMAMLAEDDRERHQMDREKLAGLIALLTKYTDNLEPKPTLVRMDVGSAMGTTSFVDGDRVGTLLTVEVMPVSDSEPRAYAIYSIVYAAALAAGRGETDDLIQRAAILEAHPKGFRKILPELRAIGIEKVCNGAGEAACRSLDGEADYLERRLEKIKANRQAKT